MMLKLPEELVGKERQRPGTNWGSPGRTGQEAGKINWKKKIERKDAGKYALGGLDLSALECICEFRKT